MLIIIKIQQTYFLVLYKFSIFANVRLEYYKMSFNY